MDSYAPLSPTTPEALPLAPLAPRGTRTAAPDAESFKQLLASQGVKIPGDVEAGGAMSEAEARVTAAQIASKAGVNAGVKRDRVMAGMDTSRPNTNSPAAAAQPGRFMPLRQGPSAARLYTGPTTSVEAAATSLAGLRATQKFAPGPVGVQQFAPPVIAAAVKRAPTDAAAETATNVAVAPSVSAPKAAEAYAYGLEAAAGDAARGKHAGEVPAWFQGAVQNALNKYDAMKATPALK